MVMKNPPHPGRSIKDACLDPLELSVPEGAERLGVARHTLSRVIIGMPALRRPDRGGHRRKRWCSRER